VAHLRFSDRVFNAARRTDLSIEKSKFESVPEEMNRSEIPVELVAKIVQACGELKLKGKTVTRERQTILV